MLHYWDTCDAFCSEMLTGSHGTKAAGSTVVALDVTFHPVQGRAPRTPQCGWILALHVGIWCFRTFLCDACGSITRKLSSKSLMTYSCGCSFTCPKPVGIQLKMRRKWSRARCCGPPCPGVATERIKPLPAAAKRHFTWAPKCKTRADMGWIYWKIPKWLSYLMSHCNWYSYEGLIQRQSECSHQLIRIDLR